MTIASKYFLIKINKSWVLTIFIFSLAISHGYSQALFCDSSKNIKANILLNEAITNNELKKTGTIALLKKAIQLDTAFSLAYFKLGEVYHTKALLSQYDIINQIHSNYYFRKASDNFHYSIELCESLNNYLAYFYLGEQFYLQKEYSLAGHYLKIFIDHNNPEIQTYKKANFYFKNIQQWKNWQKKPYEIMYYEAPEINSRHNELNPLIAANGQLIFYQQKSIKQKPNSIYQEHISELIYSKVIGLDTLENWTFAGKNPLKIQHINENEIQHISSTFNNKVLYFSDYKKVKNIDQYINTGRIFYSEIENDAWTQPVLFKCNLNRPNTFVGQPSISNDGNTMFFTSNHPDGYGGMDIYYCVKDKNGQWSDAINMGENINTINNEAAPFIHYDNSTFYFISDGHFGLGGFDLFISRKDEKGEWSKPKNMGMPINSIADEKGISIDARGIKAYISTNSKIGKGGWDIYSFDLPTELRPKEMILLGGKIIDQDSIIANVQEVEIIDLNTNDFYQIEFDENSGTFSSIIPIKQTNYYIKVKADNYSFGNTLINGNKGLHTYFETIVLNELSIGMKYYLKHVNFNTNMSFELQSILILADFARYLKSNKNVKINLIGADANINMVKNTPKLTEKAQKVYSYLIAKGISSSRLQYKSDTTVLTNLPANNPTSSEIIIEITGY